MQRIRLEQHRKPATGRPKTSAPAIAVRRSCNPEGVGLSHYVLMDRKKPK